MATKYVLKRVPVWPVARLVFVLYLILGVVIFLFYWLFLSSFSTFFSSMMGTEMGPSLGALRGLGFIMIPFLALFYAIFATLGTVICALIYNLLASIVGGVELELAERETRTSPAPAAQPPAAGSGVEGSKPINGF